MNPVDIAVIVIVSLAVVAVAGWMIYAKLKHKNIGCDCGCNGCTLCGKCHKEDKNVEDK